MRARLFPPLPLALVLGLLLAGLRAEGQEGPPSAVFQGGVPFGEAVPEELSLSLSEAVERGLRHNLGLILGREGVGIAQGARRGALADLLPQLRLGLGETREKINLAAFGFSGLPGLPEVVGPFSVFDARAFLSQSILDLKALHRARAASDELRAAEHDARNTRDLVVLACAGLYLQAVAGESRIDAARAELETAEALLTLARDRKAAGLAAGIDALRAEVQMQAQRQRLIVAEEEAVKGKLMLARAIGLPLGQRFRLADPMPLAPLPTVTPEEAVAQAWRERPDLKAALARVEAAEASRRSALGEGLPSLSVSADYGTIGSEPGTARSTFTLGAALKVPIFEGGRMQGKVREAEARLAEERARLEDLRALIYYEVQTAFLELHSAEDRVRVAQSALDLGQKELAQARDRFAAGVASNIDVIQAQEALASATENHIASLYAHNVAKVSLARALGGAETSYIQLLRGQ
jgi:outer membrane protein TolC